MFSGAIFDMDGTLLDSMIVWDRLSERYLSKFDVRVTAEDYAALEAMTQAEVAVYFCGHYPQIPETPEQVTAGFDALIEQRYRTLAKPKEGIEAYLDALRDKGVKMAVATLTDRKHAEQALEMYGLSKYFDIMLTIDEVGKNKREPEIYNRAAEALGLAPADCMVFEDAPYAAETARKAGFQVCGVIEPAYAAGEALLRAVSHQVVERSFSELLRSMTAQTEEQKE